MTPVARFELRREQKPGTQTWLWRWCLIDRTGRIVATSRTYCARGVCRNALRDALLVWMPEASSLPFASVEPKLPA
jgi:hypothetical protein